MPNYYVPFNFVGPRVTLPDESQVQSGIDFGLGGDEFTGISVGGDGGITSYGDVNHTLVSDYEDDWQHIDGVESGGYEFGAQRQFSGTAPTAPGSGVRYRRCNPTHNEVLVAAAGVGYEPTDMVFVIWAETLMDDDVVIEPKPGDKLIADQDWIIKSVKRTIDYAQWRCLCRLSTKESG